MVSRRFFLTKQSLSSLNASQRKVLQQMQSIVNSTGNDRVLIELLNKHRW
jgi:hypothetical protein